VGGGALKALKALKRKKQESCALKHFGETGRAFQQYKICGCAELTSL
jgi:hypothetical protein